MPLDRSPPRSQTESTAPPPLTSPTAKRRVPTINWDLQPVQIDMCDLDLSSQSTTGGAPILIRAQVATAPYIASKNNNPWFSCVLMSLEDNPVCHMLSYFMSNIHIA